VDRLHHLGDRRRAVGEPEARAGRGDVGRVMADRLEQPHDAVGLLRRADHHRRDEAGAQIRGEVVEHLVERRLDLLEQLLHQQVVMVGEGFEHREPRLDLARLLVAGDLGHLALGVFAVDVGAFQRQVDRADDDAVLAQRDLAQQERGRTRRLQHLQRVADGNGRLVDLVQEQDARDAELVEPAHDQLQGRDLLLVGLGDDHGEVAGGEHGLGLEGELDGAGAVDEGQAVAHEFGGGDRRLDAHRMVAGFGRMVADGAPGRNGILPRDGAGARQDRFKKGCLAACEGTDNGDAFRSRKSASGAFSHDRSTSSSSVVTEAAAGLSGRRVQIALQGSSKHDAAPRARAQPGPFRRCIAHKLGKQCCPFRVT